jgi:hypothetical protein
MHKFSAPPAATSSEPQWRALNPPDELVQVFQKAPSVTVFSDVASIVEQACGGNGSPSFEVAYEVPGKGRVAEALVSRVRNGISANYLEPYMRRRDPDCMVVADEEATDKPLFTKRYGKPFTELREQTFEWLATQDLATFAFFAGQPGMGGMDALVVAPANAAFFALGLAMLQDITPVDKISPDFQPRLLIYVAPPFRHTHFDGKQMVVHNRLGEFHEMFSYNLYPGPSAKKGVYGSLLNLGEREGWITAHCSTVQLVTPYDHIVTIMHEGASGGGKSEMLEQPHREADGRLLLGRNVVTGEERFLEMGRTCELHPVTDDMALCHPSIQKGNGKLELFDAEDAWFVRVNHIRDYATDPTLERLTAQPPVPLLFLNIDAVPDSRAMLWEHIEDEPGKPCPNPRVIIPRSVIPNIVNEPVTVDYRSLGIRTPPCTKENPSYGILGLFHVLPPALAWLWRLVAPRGYANPSIVTKEGLSSEGVGSYWPFATGRKVDQANLMLDQIRNSPSMRYVLIPNQHIGAWETGFSPQWIAREYLARRGTAPFRSGLLTPSRSRLLGHSLFQLTVEGYSIPRWFLQVDTQPEVGPEAYDQGAAMLESFFEAHVNQFLHEDLDPLGRRIIEQFLGGAGLEDFETMLPSE